MHPNLVINLLIIINLFLSKIVIIKVINADTKLPFVGRFFFISKISNLNANNLEIMQLKVVKN